MAPGIQARTAIPVSHSSRGAAVAMRGAPQGRPTHLIHGVAKIVAYVSRYVTREPGEPVSVTVEGVGTLTNPVVRGE